MSNYYFKDLDIWNHWLSHFFPALPLYYVILCTAIWLCAACVTEQHLCHQSVSVTRWGRLFEFDEQILKKGSSVLHETLCGTYDSKPYYVCTPTLTLTPTHYFLMSNHHLTGAHDSHERQLITHGKSVGHSKLIRHKKYLDDKCSPKNIFTLSKERFKEYQVD